MVATTIDELLTTIADWVEDVTGRVTLIQNTNGPAPAAKYCTVWLSAFRPLRHDVKTYDCTGDAMTETIRGLADVSVDITAWGGDDAMQIMNRLNRSTLADERNFDIYRIMGRGAIGETRDLTAATSAVQRPRVEFRMSGQCAFSEEFNAPFFDNIGIIINEEHLGQVAEFNIGTNNPPESQRQTK